MFDKCIRALDEVMAYHTLPRIVGLNPGMMEHFERVILASKVHSFIDANQFRGIQNLFQVGSHVFRSIEHSRYGVLENEREGLSDFNYGVAQLNLVRDGYAPLRALLMSSAVGINKSIVIRAGLLEDKTVFGYSCDLKDEDSLVSGLVSLNPDDTEFFLDHRSSDPIFTFLRDNAKDLKSTSKEEHIRTVSEMMIALANVYDHQNDTFYSGFDKKKLLHAESKYLD